MLLLLLLLLALLLLVPTPLGSPLADIATAGWRGRRGIRVFLCGEQEWELSSKWVVGHGGWLKVLNGSSQWRSHRPLPETFFLFPFPTDFAAAFLFAFTGCAVPFASCAIAPFVWMRAGRGAGGPISEPTRECEYGR